MSHTVGQSAALAGIPAGLQAQGLWAGRRQLFVRFAGEAETATMYTAEALSTEIQRGTSRSSYHSIAISGRDPLANVEFLCAVFEKAKPSIPIMLDGDGQRPEAIRPMRGFLSLAQVTIDGPAGDAQAERALETLQVAAESDVAHALVMCMDERTTDTTVLRLIERAHAVSAETSVVLHPGAGVPVDRDRRWSVLLEHAVGLHRDVRLTLRLPPPTGMR